MGKLVSIYEFVVRKVAHVGIIRWFNALDVAYLILEDYPIRHENANNVSSRD